MDLKFILRRSIRVKTRRPNLSPTSTLTLSHHSALNFLAFPRLAFCRRDDVSRSSAFGHSASRPYERLPSMACMLCMCRLGIRKLGSQFLLSQIRRPNLSPKSTLKLIQSGAQNLSQTRRPPFEPRVDAHIESRFGVQLETNSAPECEPTVDAQIESNFTV